MNWVDAVLIVLLLAAVIVGSKKGLIREISATVIVFASIILTIEYIDQLTVWLYDNLGGSPLISAFLSFIILLGATYAAFKLLGMAFYRVADIEASKKRDQMGGALIGFVRGWVAIGFLTFLVFLLPMPDGFYEDFEASFFGPTVAKTIPLIYETTSPVHPKSKSFIQKIESTLLTLPEATSSGQKNMSEDRAEVHRVMYHIDRFFNTNSGAI
ncbi:hypothetical protein GF377_03390 [candidate division GN15 bacterium]|nr:hypothetical protein [candidate division GN15 bacterium]